MASSPGLFTDWPWKKLGNFKYVILAPFVAHSFYSFVVNGKTGKRDITNFLILPFLLSRMLHDQIWISYSRYRTAKGSSRILDKTIEFEQVDRERNWDDQILLNGIVFYIANKIIPVTSQLPFWRTDGVIISVFLHVGPVEFLYYWLHRALHHHYLYSRYHSHHHSSIVTEPITSVVHPFVEMVAYFVLFAIPMLTTLLTGTGSLAVVFGYSTYIDFMNNLGHCNFEIIPNWLFSVFPPLKYFMYTPSFHSLHHTEFRTNFSLFMPIYDYIYGTMDKSSDSLQEKSLQRPEEMPDVVHLTHLTTLESIFQLRLGFASLASNPQVSTWYTLLMLPVTWWSLIITYLCGRTFTLERNVFGKLKLQSWAIPRYSSQYFSSWQRESINGLIEKAILEAEARGTKVFSIGLLNQGEELNMNGELFIKRYPKLNLKVVDGSSLVVSIVLNNIPKGTTQVLLRGHLSKVAYSIAKALSQSGIQVSTLYKAECDKLKQICSDPTREVESENNFIVSSNFNEKVWLVGDGLTDEEQTMASKGTLFIPFSQLPPKKVRYDCSYHYTPAMRAPVSLKNLHSCENWLPRRAMSASRIAGIVHASEGWNVHESGNTMFSVDKIWEATLQHGFQPLTIKDDQA